MVPLLIIFLLRWQWMCYRYDLIITMRKFNYFWVKTCVKKYSYSIHCKKYFRYLTNSNTNRISSPKYIRCLIKEKRKFPVWNTINVQAILTWQNNWFVACTIKICCVLTLTKRNQAPPGNQVPAELNPPVF